MHQFSKVEMFVVCTPQQSEIMLAELCGLEEEIFTELGLHFKMLVADLANRTLSSSSSLCVSSLN